MIWLHVDEASAVRLGDMAARLEALGKKTEWFMKYAGRQVVNTAKRLAKQNASNIIVRRRTGTLVGWISQQRAVLGDKSVSWGLPDNEKESRIAKLLNEGGTITPKTSQFLRVPVPGGPADQGRGVDPFAGIALRTVPGFCAVRSKTRGNPILMRRDGVEPAVPWYFLVRSVTIPPHPWFSDAVDTTVSLIPVIIESRLHGLETMTENEEPA